MFYYLKSVIFDQMNFIFRQRLLVYPAGWFKEPLHGPAKCRVSFTQSGFNTWRWTFRWQACANKHKNTSGKKCLKPKLEIKVCCIHC